MIKCLVLTKDFEGTYQINKLLFTEVSFWVRLCDLPLNLMNETVGRLVGDSIAYIVEMDVDRREVAWG